MDDVVADLNRLITPAEAAALAGVEVDTIKKWRQRGHITPAKIGPRRTPLYRLIDVAKAERKLRDTARRRYPTAA